MVGLQPVDDADSAEDVVAFAGNDDGMCVCFKTDVAGFSRGRMVTGCSQSFDDTLEVGHDGALRGSNVVPAQDWKFESLMLLLCPGNACR